MFFILRSSKCVVFIATCISICVCILSGFAFVHVLFSSPLVSFDQFLYVAVDRAFVIPPIHMCIYMNVFQMSSMAEFSLFHFVELLECFTEICTHRKKDIPLNIQNRSSFFRPYFVFCFIFSLAEFWMVIKWLSVAHAAFRYYQALPKAGFVLLPSVIWISIGE